MDQTLPGDVSPYHLFTRSDWAKLRAGQPMTLTEEDIDRLQSLNDPVSMEEVVAIYLPLSRLLSLYVEASQALFDATHTFLGGSGSRVPYVIGVAGSVSVGKSTTARLLQALLARWPAMPKVDLVTTDGFLLPNAVLEAEGIMDRKGFPESYDLPALLTFLAKIKAGVPSVPAPVYSHFYYDVLPDQSIVIDRPDILIVEGLNVLQSRKLKDGRTVPFVSDFFDFSVYIDAEEALLEKWYVDRFQRLRSTAFRDPNSYFHKYAELTDAEADATALSIWQQINLLNLRENIRPTRARADLILTKGASHMIEEVRLRKI
ncbi:MAG: type I pantothenate kinase [Hyphomicrobiaceae bacterium]|nr:type I pantothenate kinase [Hyphomicrobiaceae bacterium]